MSPRIELRDYGFCASDTGAWLLRNISLSLSPGTRLGITGRSGSGKTTLCHVLAGVESLTLHGTHTGSILVDGVERTRTSTFAGDKFHPPMSVGIVLQNPESQLFGETVLEEVRYGVHACSEIAATNALRLVGLESFAAQPIRTLSLGQKQRVVIAAFLAADPQLLILDEPTNYLDVAAAEDLFRLLRTLPVTQVVVEHDVERLCNYAHFLLELEKGEVAAQGTPAAWLQETQSDPRFFRVASLLVRGGLTTDGLSSPGSYCVSTDVESVLRNEQPSEFTARGGCVIQCAGLTAGYEKGNSVLKNISFSASSGERIALLGLNGSGKTTLLKCFSGLVEPQGGTVTINGAAPRPGIAGFVYQNPDYQIFEQTVEDECGFALRLRRFPESEIRARVDHWLTETCLLHVRHRLPLSLSYGEKRRLTLASVLAAQSCVLLLDEPTTALDDKHIEDLSRLLIQIGTELPLVLLFATHDIDFALDTATRIILLVEGRIVKDIPRHKLSFEDLSGLGMPLPFLCSVLAKTTPPLPPVGSMQLYKIIGKHHDDTQINGSGNNN